MHASQPPCLTCQQLLESAASAPLCEACLFDTLSQAATHVVDNSLYERQFLVGITTLKDSLGLGLTESKFLYAWRYHHLRLTTPDRFPYPDKTYWMA